MCAICYVLINSKACPCELKVVLRSCISCIAGRCVHNGASTSSPSSIYTPCRAWHMAWHNTHMPPRYHNNSITRRYPTCMQHASGHALHPAVLPFTSLLSLVNLTALLTSLIPRLISSHRLSCLHMAHLEASPQRAASSTWRGAPTCSLVEVSERTTLGG